MGNKLLKCERTMEGRRSLEDHEFTDMVLSWSLEKIFDTNLYKNQVEKIPESFQSVDQYLSSYVFPLLEETRAELASAMETTHDAPFAKVNSITSLGPENLLHSVKVDFFRNRGRGREPYRTLPGDIVLLSDLKPESHSYLCHVVTTFSEDENGDAFTSTRFEVKTATSIDVGAIQKATFYVVFLMNLATNRRIWNALRTHKNSSIIEKVLDKNELDEEHWESCPMKCRSQMEVDFEPTPSSRLNESQKNAVLASLIRTGCKHRASVELICGPPGTGKTRTLSVLLHNLLIMKVRTLICAPTNVAILELASHMISLSRESFQDKRKMFLSCPLGDMLIFGNEDTSKIGSDTKEIFLDYRVNKLIECLVSPTGLKHWISSMLDFLGDYVSQNHIYLDNKVIKVEENQEGEIRQSEFKSCLKNARRRFKRIATSLVDSLSTFITHLPRSFILAQNLQNVAELMSLLDSIEALLFEESLAYEELNMVPLNQRATSSQSSLAYMRKECLCTLRSLQSSLAAFGLPLGTYKTSISDFCFQKASLIFCTISSSYTLHSMDIQPFNLVVIDEAAQIKESESIISLQFPDVRHAILVGDERQLQSTVKSKLSEDAGFGRSLFERLRSLGHSKHLLDMQYRMHPSISRFPNSNFYDKQMLDAPSVQSESYERCYLEGKMFGPYSFIDIPGGKEEVDDVGNSIRNMLEVAVTLKIVQKLYNVWNSSKEKLSIGVISPYVAQVAAIQDRMNQNYGDLESFKVKVKSVDGFQGGEEDIIIISTVRSNKSGSIGFLANPQRINVALTRARHCLWILGNEGTLSRSDSLWEALIRDAKHRQCFFTAIDDFDIRRTVITVKKELDQLEDILNGESIRFKYARWKVIFSDNFRKSFGKLEPYYVKSWVINMLLKIASGWRPKKKNVDMECKRSNYVVKQFKVEGYYVLCSVDIIKDSIWTQVLKVWDVLPLMETQELLKRLDDIFSILTEDYIIRCKEKCIEVHFCFRNLEVPKSWSSFDDIVKSRDLYGTKSSTNPAGDCRSYVEDSKVSESLLLMKFYSLSSGSAKHLLSDNEGIEVELPFEVSNEEREAMVFPRSSFILGRSGTGKTTVLTMKLFQKQQQYLIASGDYVATPNKMLAGERVDDKQCQGQSTLRQLFVTVSPKLCHAVKRHVSQLKRFSCEDLSASSSVTDTDDIEEMAAFEDIPDTFVGIQPEKYPLIITFHKFLMMLDGTLGNSYFKKFNGVRDHSQYKCRSFRSIALQTLMRKNEVTYDRFSSLYWPHFSSNLTKNLDPSRVFTEIMSHIKGGLQAGEACDGTRNRKDYVSLSESRVSTLSAEKREVIYDIYQVYEKMKMKRCEFDVSDFVNDIHLRLSKENLTGDKMDFVYIDEVQDLNMRQIALFRHICKNVDEGFVFSGDTAQTVARGIDFRFQDIRSLFYNEFVLKSKYSESPGGVKKGLISDCFSLCQNFRTHIGVLRLAQSVIDLLFHFFPLSVDALPPETSLIHGESPVAIEPGSDENSIITIFGGGGSGKGKWSGFGAEQVILVRDDSTRKEISKYIGSQALVLTIIECKGLEFEDVLLYNFFGSSPLGSQWRVLYEFLMQKDPFYPNFPKSFPSFSPSKHSIMCSELKQLYVAITRTRQRLWICENDAELSKPMFDYWQGLGLVQVRKLDDSLALEMQRASSPEEWESRGIKLFWEKHYEMATMCFQRAGERIWEKRAKASWLRSSADHLRISNPMEARVLIREAAELFDSIGRATTAAECLCEFGEYESAGMIYLNKCGTSELRKAGECFILAGCNRTAAEAYAKGNWFPECLSACMKGKLFEMGLQYMEFWQQQATFNPEIMSKLKDIVKIKQEFLESGALEYHRTKNEVSFMKFVRAFGTTESKRKFLRSVGCLEGLLNLEKESGNYKEAAEVAKLMGDILAEIDLLVKAGDFANATFLIVSYVLSNSIWVSTNQGWPMKSFPQKEKLISKLMAFAEKVSGNFRASICTESKILSHEHTNLFELMQSYIASGQCESRTGEILCVRKLLDVHFGIPAAKYERDHELPIDLKCYSVGKISRNKVSVITLVYLWNMFKENSLEIIESLGCLERSDNHNFKGTIEFCLHYFGVRLSRDSSNTCHLMNPNAKWVENVHGKFMHRNRKVRSLHVRHFVSAAREYWYQELVSVGFRALEALRSLYEFSVVKTSSLYCQGICLTFIFDITKFLMESKYLDSKKSGYSKLEEFLQLSTKYFEIAFPLDPRQSLSANLILLRETELSNNLLEEVVSRCINTRHYLTPGQIGKVMMIWLGSGKAKHSLCERILASCLPENSHWKAVVEILGHVMKPGYPVGSGTNNLAPQVLLDTTSGNVTIQSGNSLHSPLSSSGEYLSDRLYKALEETCTPNNMPPNFFLYLLERLLILAPRPDGCFFTTKSSFVEWIVCQPPNANPSPALATDVESSLTSIDDLSFGVVNHFLDKDTDFLKEWIRCSNIDHNYFPVLVLKLIMILCLVCLNSRMSLDILFELLARPLIRSHLQKQFYEALMCGKANNSSSIVTVAAALKAIGDPMVIVTLRENNFNLVCPDAIFLDLGLFSCKSDVINVLFPRSTGTSNARVGTDEGSVIESGIGFSGIGHIPGKSTTALEMMPKSTDANSASENEKVELQLRWGFLGDVLDMLLFHRSKENGNLKTVAPEKKLEVQEHMNFLAAALLQLTEHESRLSMTDENMCEAQNTIEELKQLSSLLDKSNLDGDEDLSEIEELVKSLELRRPRLEDMLSSVLDTNSSNTKVLNFGKDSLSNLEDWQI